MGNTPKPITSVLIASAPHQVGATWSRENRRLAVEFDAHFVERSSSFAVYPLNLTKQLFTRGTLKPSYLHVLYVEFQCNMVLVSVELGLATVK